MGKVSTLLLMYFVQMVMMMMMHLFMYKKEMLILIWLASHGKHRSIFSIDFFALLHYQISMSIAPQNLLQQDHFVS